jgi:hypothetical protein
MSEPEIFDQQRMDRCAKIQRAIMKNWQRTNSFTYTVGATDSVNGITLDELRKRYFAVGVGQDLVEVPLTDVLVIFSMIRQEVAALKKIKGKPPSNFKDRFQISTAFSDEEAVGLLSGIPIETPFDQEKYLRFKSSVRPADGTEDDAEDAR